MGFLDNLKNLFMDPGLVKELCIHLEGQGISARVLDPKSPEAIQHKPILHIFGNPPMGSIKIEGRNIDILELYRVTTPGRKNSPSQIYHVYNYVINSGAEGHEEQLKAEFRAIEKGLFKKEIIGYEWRGGQLAQDLSNDSDLNKMMLNIGMPKINVFLNKKEDNIVISVTPDQVTDPRRAGTTGDVKSISSTIHSMGVSTFPSREAFEAYDKIAKHVRNLVST